MGKGYSICVGFIMVGILLLSDALHAQSKDELESKKMRQLQELEYATKLLEETRANKKSTYNELLLVNKKIEIRENIIDDISHEVNTIESRIAENQDIVNSLTRDLSRKKKEYEELIVFAYKNRGEYTDVMYILAARNINEAYKRYRYIKQLTDYRKQQADLIVEIRRVLESKTLELEVRKKEKEILLIQQKEEQATLKLEKKKKNEVVADLQNKEKELKRDIKKKERILAEIEKRIDALIKAETEKAVSGNLYERLTPSERIISNEFGKNKGRLPWPTERGLITSKFGKQPHPVLSGVTVQNNGIDISTTKNAGVRCVFEGEVTLIAAIPGGNYAVIVRHGDYFTVYQNITRVKVKQGDKVETNQVLGYVYSEENENAGILHFELRKEYDKLNPEDWLSM